jgi:AcrR family transcriptional regulator
MPEQDATEERIIRHVTEQFFALGFSRLTMDQIARELGMSKKTLYRYFSGKEALLEAMFDRELGWVGERMDAIFADTERGFIERTTAIFGLIGYQLRRISPSLVADLRRHAPDTFRRIEEFRRRKVFDRLGDHFDQGIREGVVRSDIDTRLAVLLVTRFAESALDPARLQELEVTPHHMFRTMLRIVYGGLLTEEGRDRLSEIEFESSGGRLWDEG